MDRDGNDSIPATSTSKSRFGRDDKYIWSRDSDILRNRQKKIITNLDSIYTNYVSFQL